MKVKLTPERVGEWIGIAFAVVVSGALLILILKFVVDFIR